MNGDRLNILLLSEFFPPHVSGGAHARYKFSQIAVDEGHEIQVFTPLIEGAPKHERKDGIEIFRPLRSQPSGSLVPTDPIAMIFRLFFAIWLSLYLPLWMKKNEVDAIHSTEHLLHPVAKFLGMLYRKPVVNFLGYTPSLYEDEEGSSLASILEGLNLRFFTGDSVFCRSEGIKDIIEKRSGDPDVNLLHGILDEDKIRNTVMKIRKKGSREKVREELGFEKEEKMLVFAARLTPVKAPRRSIELLTKLPEDHRLFMIGDGPEMEDVKDVVTSLGVESRVDLLGKKNHEETLKMIACSDAVILTSRAEAYPTVVFEALAFNRDVFSTPVGILKEINEDNLHISEFPDLEDIILSYELDNEIKVDESIVKRYSMDNYTQTILSDIRKRTGGDEDD